MTEPQKHDRSMIEILESLRPVDDFDLVNIHAFYGVDVFHERQRIAFVEWAGDVLRPSQDHKRMASRQATRILRKELRLAWMTDSVTFLEKLVEVNPEPFSRLHLELIVDELKWPTDSTEPYTHANLLNALDTHY